eukprot:scaffold276436_cov33-Tisochrysis_lutea.AAC.3
MAPVRKRPPSTNDSRLPAQGTGRTKRTPTSAFDGAAWRNIYELRPEKIVAQRQRTAREGCDV